MSLVRFLGVLAATFWTASLPGCSVDVNFGDREWSCAGTSLCQSGYECVAKRCVPVGSTTTVDASVDPLTDAAVPLAPVIPPFAAGTLNAELTGDQLVGDDDSTFTADRLVVIFNNSGDFWTSSRQSVDDAWPAPMVDLSISSPENDQTLAISADGLTVLFGSNRPGGFGLVDLYMARRNQRSDSWDAPVLLTGVNGPTNDLASWVSNDGRSISFHSDSTGDYDIYEAAGDPSTGVFGDVSAMSAFNVVGSTDSSARFVLGGLVLTFHSNRQGSDDLYVATRATVDEPFGPATEIVGVNTEDVEQDIWMSEDLCLIAFVKRADDGLLRIHESTCTAP